MKWYEIFVIIATFIGALLGVNEMLSTIGLENMNGKTLTFLISAIFTSLIVIVLIQIQQNNDLKTMKSKLKIKEDKNFIEKMISKGKNKRGNIDPRILLWILIAILAYLFLKSIFPNMFG